MEFEENPSNIDNLNNSMLDSITTPATRCVANSQVIETEPHDTERVPHTKSPIGLEKDDGSHFFNLDQSELAMLDKLANSEIDADTKQSHYDINIKSCQDTPQQIKQSASQFEVVSKPDHSHYSPEKNLGISRSPSRSPSRASTDREEKQGSEEERENNHSDIHQDQSSPSSNTSVQNVHQIEEHYVEQQDAYGVTNPSEMSHNQQLDFHEQTASAFLETQKVPTQSSVSPVQSSPKQNESEDASEAEVEPVELYSPFEISKMSDDEKQSYINGLKNEINSFPYRDYDQKHEELVLLHKSQQLEEELQAGELENRKLQLWILDDKYQALLKQEQKAIDEREHLMGMMEDIQENISVAKTALVEKDQEIQEVKQELKTKQKDVRVGESSVESVQGSNTKLGQELEKEQTKLQSKQKKADKLQKEFDKIDKKVRQKEKDYEELKNKKLTVKQQAKAHELLMQRIKEEIDETNESAEKFNEERDMFETMKSYLQKKNAILNKDVKKQSVKKKNDEEFIEFGVKNNNLLKNEIKENKDIIEDYVMENRKLEQEIYIAKQQNEYDSKHSEQLQQQIDHLTQCNQQLNGLKEEQMNSINNVNSVEDCRNQMLMMVMKKQEILTPQADNYAFQFSEYNRPKHQPSYMDLPLQKKSPTFKEGSYEKDSHDRNRHRRTNSRSQTRKDSRHLRSLSRGGENRNRQSIGSINSLNMHETNQPAQTPQPKDPEAFKSPLERKKEELDHADKQFQQSIDQIKIDQRAQEQNHLNFRSNTPNEAKAFNQKKETKKLSKFLTKNSKKDENEQTNQYMGQMSPEDKRYFGYQSQLGSKDVCNTSDIYARSQSNHHNKEVDLRKYLDTFVQNKVEDTVTDFGKSSRAQKLINKYDNRDANSGRSLPPAPGYERNRYCKSVTNYNNRDMKRDKSIEIQRDRETNGTALINRNNYTEISTPGLDTKSHGNAEKQTFYSKFLKAKQQLRDQDQHVAQNQGYYFKYQPVGTDKLLETKANERKTTPVQQVSKMPIQYHQEMSRKSVVYEQQIKNAPINQSEDVQSQRSHGKRKSTMIKDVIKNKKQSLVELDSNAQMSFRSGLIQPSQTTVEASQKQDAYDISDVSYRQMREQLDSQYGGGKRDSIVKQAQDKGYVAYDPNKSISKSYEKYAKNPCDYKMEQKSPGSYTNQSQHKTMVVSHHMKRPSELASQSNHPHYLSEYKVSQPDYQASRNIPYSNNIKESHTVDYQQNYMNKYGNPQNSKPEPTTQGYFRNTAETQPNPHVSHYREYSSGFKPEPKTEQQLMESNSQKLEVGQQFRSKYAQQSGQKDNLHMYDAAPHFNPGKHSIYDLLQTKNPRSEENYKGMGSNNGITSTKQFDHYSRNQYGEYLTSFGNPQQYDRTPTDKHQPQVSDSTYKPTPQIAQKYLENTNKNDEASFTARSYNQSDQTGSQPPDIQIRNNANWTNQYHGGSANYASGSAPDQLVSRSFHQQKPMGEDFGKKMAPKYGPGSTNETGPSASFIVHKAQHASGYPGFKESATSASFMPPQGSAQEHQALGYATKGTYGIHQASMPYNKAGAHDEERTSVKDSVLEEYCRDSAKDGQDMQQTLPQDLFMNNKDYAKHPNFY